MCFVVEQLIGQGPGHEDSEAPWTDPHLISESHVGDGFVGSLMGRFNCMSIWVAAPLALFVSTNPLNWAISWLARSGAACLLERLGAASAGGQDKQHTEGNDDVLR